MSLPLSRYLERRRQLRRCARFVRDIERYRREVLAPRGLGDFTPRPVADKRKRLVFLGDARVWKFHRAARRDARNAIEAARRLQDAGIPAPRTEFSDVGSETRDRYGLSCIVMNRLEGRALDRNVDPATAREIAAFLARLHAVRSPSWGDCHALKPEGYFEDYFVRRIRNRWKLVDAWIAETAIGPSPGPHAWFESRRTGLAPSGGLYCLVTADAQPRNFLRSPSGELALIDLDRVRFLDFPVDLVQFMPLESPMLAAGPDASGPELIRAVEQASADFLDAYFAAAPPEAESHWRQTRDAYIVAQMVLKLYGVLRRREVKFSLFKSVEREKIDAQARHHFSVIRRLTAIP